MKRVQILLATCSAAVAVGLWLAFTSPTDVLQGEFSRILNIHAPSMWVAFLAFGVTALASIVWLVRKTPRWDRLGEASAELGVLFTVIGLFTGMVWGQAVWGRAWDWGDARMASTAVMLFVYIGYLALRRATPDPEMRARRSAILGAVAVVQVPLVYFSVYMFRTLHQTPSIRPDGATMPREMLVALLVNFAAFTYLFVALLFARLEVARAEEGASVEAGLAGDSVKPPRLSEVKDV
ncbi:MAG TPA: cytochrome c biogenesis protein CcsA [Acidimicrobiia bacterium]|nr:cytochrome c biogenesis protein CcsA [Acidimicrobiia bacterium]